MHIKKSSLLLSIALIAIFSAHAGESKDKQSDYERTLIFKWAANIATAGTFGKSVPVRIAGMMWLGYQASTYTGSKNQKAISLSDLKGIQKLPFYHNLNLDIRCLQEQYIKKIQTQQAAQKKSVKFILDNNGSLIKISPKSTSNKQQLETSVVTVEFKKPKSVPQKKLPEAILFNMHNNPFDHSNTLQDKALLSSPYITVTDGINRGVMRKIK